MNSLKNKKKPLVYDITPGQRFGILTTVKLTNRGLWLCQCDCGSEVNVYASRLKYRSKKSCGNCMVKREKPKQYKPTLCWGCQRAAGLLMKTCPWAYRFEPVDGWTALPTNVYIESSRAASSFYVTECPLFKPDAEGQPAVNLLRDLGLVNL